MHVSPIPRPSAHIHEPISRGDAPAARAASKTITAELVKPTSTATNPAATADGLRASRKRTSRQTP